MSTICNSKPTGRQALLVIESSAPAIQAGIARMPERAADSDAPKLITRTQIAGASSLKRHVEEMLDESGFKPHDIFAIAVSCGPGSFTGLRIGYSFAKGLALACGAAIYAVDGLLAAAWCLRGLLPGGENEKIVAVVRDAGRDECFLAAYSFRQMNCKRVIAPCILPKSNIGEHVHGCCKHCSAGDVDWVLDKGVADTEFPALSGHRLHYAEDIARGMSEYLCLAQGIQLGTEIAGKAQADELNGFERVSPVSLERLAELKPFYLREVAAKSLEERAAPRSSLLHLK